MQIAHPVALRINQSQMHQQQITASNQNSQQQLINPEQLTYQLE